MDWDIFLDKLQCLYSGVNEDVMLKSLTDEERELIAKTFHRMNEIQGRRFYERD